jgi:hypothetical protein
VPFGGGVGRVFKIGEQSINVDMKKDWKEVFPCK